MMKLERRFSDWPEFQQEFDSNLKNFGLFIPGSYQLQMREKVELKLWLPGARQAVLARAEVVAAFPAGVALHLEFGPETLKQIAELESKLKPAAGAEPQTAAAAPAGEEIPAEETVESEADGALAEPVAPEPEAVVEEESAESAEEIEQRVALSGGDYSNLFAAVRKLSRPEKIKLAKRGGRKYLLVLIQEGDRQLMRFVIQNPRLSTVEVLQILKTPQLTTENVTELARNPAFAQNDEVRFQIAIHPKTPLTTSMGLLVSLNQRQLQFIAKSKNMKHQLKSSALKLVLKRQSDGF